MSSFYHNRKSKNINFTCISGVRGEKLLLGEVFDRGAPPGSCNLDPISDVKGVIFQ